MTEWRCIPGYEGIYAVSSDGEVMSMNYANSGMPGLMKPKIDIYKRVALRKGTAKQRTLTVHSLVAAAFIGPRPSGHQVNHIDGDKLNNRVENLEYCTRSENMKHAFRTGLQDNHGENHSRAKLNDIAIKEIRQRAGNGEKLVSIAKDYGIDQSAISRIVSGKRWGHVSFDRKAG